ncbi:NAD+ kinase [Haladaptatus litoreus]|uniref:NAD kinase n=1 Tax=Haladaptatus litoreus TaxID=553468 RepID=A0A1N6ZZB2_9EURY|nr:NAD(+)/NADH kinase [Haladaptatus litoreus]SIR32165.1 NAD+ kinase [Haladaptatus litoreus]
MNVGIVAQRGNERAATLAGRLQETLAEENVTVRIDAATAEQLGIDGVDVSRMAENDLVVSIGGDGTFLFAASGAGGTPILGVNLGEVGFLNAVAPEEAVDEVRAVVAEYHEFGEIPSRAVPRLRASGEGDWSVHPALNEIVIQGAQRGHGQGLDYEVHIDGVEYGEGHADGVLVSTPTGSTAYNLSEGGPLVHPGVDGLVFTEMCADNPMPPLVFDPDHDVVIRVENAPFAVVGSDGTQVRIEPPETITVSLAPEPAHIAGPSTNFFGALSKLD